MSDLDSNTPFEPESQSEETKRKFREALERRIIRTPNRPTIATDSPRSTTRMARPITSESSAVRADSRSRTTE